MIDDEPAEVSALKFQYNELKSSLQSAEKVNSDESAGIASAQTENLKQIWAEFRVAFRALAVSSNKVHLQDIDFLQVQEQYVQVCGKLNDIANDAKKKANVELPKIKLPEFDGKSNWIAFISLFDKIVHENKSLDNGIKIQYLKSNVKGSAEQLIGHIKPYASNYMTCYELLRKRFDNKRMNLAALLDKMINFPKIEFESGEKLRALHDTIWECMLQINNMKVETASWDPLINHIMLRKLDDKTVKHYECQLTNVRETQKLSDFLSYIEMRFLALESAEGKFPTKKKSIAVKKSVEKKCHYCNDEHYLGKCAAFQKLEVQPRIDFVKEKHLCTNCFGEHKVSECKSKYTCSKCQKKHNTLLHLDDFKPRYTKQKMYSEPKAALASTALTSMITVNDEDAGTVSSVQSLISTERFANLLGTAMVQVQSGFGEWLFMKAVVDNGSQSAMIREEAAQILKLVFERVYAPIDGFDETKKIASKQVKLRIKPRFDSAYELETEALVFNKVTNLKVFKGDLREYEHLQNLQYADPTVNSDRPIDLLLGVAEYGDFLKCGLIKGPKGTPIAQNTEFGWVIMGAQNLKKTPATLTTLISNVNIDEKLSDFFASEDLDDEEDVEELSAEETYCEEFFVKTTERDETGYIVRIPFKNRGEPDLGNSRKAALAMLFQMEKRFKNNPNLKKQYCEAIDDAIRQGHLKRVTTVPVDAHYLPHHAVFKDSSTTKLRTVFNASQKTSNGKSFNEQVAVGKISQPKIFNLLMRWRKYKIAVVADIEKMYKQIRIADDQQKYQMILWRNNPSETIGEYALTTVTFGVTQSPFVAIRVLKQLAHEIAEKYPLAAKAILESFYMDDFSGGADTVEEASEVCRQLKAGLKSGGFNIRKFGSNSNELMSRIPVEDREIANENIIKALGLVWRPETDMFTYKLNMQLSSLATTRRKLFSEVATLFDPLGLIAPIMTKAKILMREVWSLRKDGKRFSWDDQLPKEMSLSWARIKSELPLITKLNIPRWIETTKNTKTELHGFCDACNAAYAAEIYIKNWSESNEISVNLLVAKTKVAPIGKKTLTIPRLELCGAVLLARLARSVIDTMKIDFADVVLWTDSKIVLAWLEGNPKRWKSFVAAKNAVWLHVSGIDNPADCASRGIYPSELATHKLWWHGPKFLLQDVDKTPGKVDFETLIDTNRELSILNVTVKEPNILAQVSSWLKLQKIMAYVVRFVENAKKDKVKTKGELT
ncbi:uncharacterized protein LOC116346586, partial [Contarinia nasturtii]|uniref:uncharacterized protein LOC116346586 n=1 Tax=Contarinia nasturtii TaxID=265458 RepID=UPI0012D37E17